MSETLRRAAAPIGSVLPDYLTAWAGDDALARAVAATIASLAEAAAGISRLVGWGPLVGGLSGEAGSTNSDGDAQKPLDIESNRLILDALRNSPTAYYASEEEPDILSLRPGAALAVAVDPLDGSSNIDVNLSIGTIFSIFPASLKDAAASFLRPAEQQVAAGYFIYGPHTALVLTLGAGVDLFVLEPSSQSFKLARAALRVPADAKEYAVNSSNYRHWSPAIRRFIDDCAEGIEGPRAKNFNMRWNASLVAEAHRILTRGGVFLYPGDARPGYEQGRLRFVYEAAPIAMLAEQAGGEATDGVTRILAQSPDELHQRTPLIFGSTQLVATVSEYHADRDSAATRYAR